MGYRPFFHKKCAPHRRSAWSFVLIFRSLPPDLAPCGLPQVAGLHRAVPSATLDKGIQLSAYYISHVRDCQEEISLGECLNEELKEVKERKRDSRSGMEGTIGVFVTAKPVVGMNENSKNGLKILQLSWKTPAFPGKGGNIMT